MTTIKLQTSDNVLFELELPVAKCFGTIKTMLEDCGLMEEGMNDVIPLPNITAATLCKVIEWAKHYQNFIAPVEKDGENQSVPEWDERFLQVDQETLGDLIMAANFLDIRTLLLSGCKTAAKMIRGKSPEELRDLFNIENDLVDDDDEDGPRGSQK